MVEHGTFNAGVAGSNPARLTMSWIRDEVSVPQLRGGKGDGVVTTPNPLPTKQMWHNDLTRRATLIIQSNVCQLSDTALIV